MSAVTNHDGCFRKSIPLVSLAAFLLPFLSRILKVGLPPANGSLWAGGFSCERKEIKARAK